MSKKSIFFSFLILFITSSLFAKTVKVGYYQNSGNLMSGASEKDPKKGYAYEYIQTVSAYTGWDFEYIYGTRAELYEALIKGEIDILPNVQLDDVTTKDMLFPDYIMGIETYYLYSKKKNFSIISGNLFSMDGKTVGIEAGTHQAGLYRRWIETKPINLSVKYLSVNDDVIEMFENNEFDLFLQTDTIADSEWDPVYKIGESDFYLAVSKSRPDLLVEMNHALTNLYNSNPYYNNTLWSKYYSNVPTTKKLTTEELEWLNRKGSITFGCLQDDVPFTIIDKSGNTTGFIADFVDNLKVAFSLRKLEINYIYFDTFDSLTDALSAGKIDTIFPYNRDFNESEREGFILSDKIISIPMSYVYKDNQPAAFMQKIAVPEGQRALGYLRENYPNLVPSLIDDTEECLDSVIYGKVNGTVIDSYKVQTYLPKRSKYKNLKIMGLPQTCDVCFAVDKTNTPLISILNKANFLIPSEEKNTMLAKHLLEYRESSFEYFWRNYSILVVILFLLFVTIFIALICSIEKIKEYMNFDTLTHLLNRRRLDAYMEKSIKRWVEKEEPFSILLFDLDNFKSINDTYGHDCGDKVLQVVAANIISGIKPVDTAFRWGGEEFLVLLNTNNMIAATVAERIRKNIEKSEIEYKGKVIHITTTIGVATYEEGITDKELFILADEKMYKGKHNGKNQVVL